MMLEFVPGHDKELLDWSHSHYAGVVLVKADKGRFRIHRPNCDHIFWIEKGKRLAGQPRYCFDSEAEARHWVKVQRSAALIECQSCYE
jgi:hypothetical protein